MHLRKDLGDFVVIVMIQCEGSDQLIILNQIPGQGTPLLKEQLLFIEQDKHS